MRHTIFSSFLVLLTPSFFAASVFAQGVPKPAPIYADVESIVTENCVGCHSADIALGDVVLDTEDNLKALSKEALAAVKAGLMPAGDEGFKDTADGLLLIQYLESLQVRAVVYSDVAPILLANCLSCHSGSSARKGIRYDTEALAIRNASRSISEVSRSRMPPRKPNFKASAEGQLLLSWFQAPLPTPKP